MANQVCGPRMLLDCTLRDGGYVNNWEFEEDTVRKVVRALYEAGVRYIELGILGQGGKPGRSTKFSDFVQIEPYLEARHPDCRYAVMLNQAEAERYKIPVRSEKTPDLIRIAFFKPEYTAAMRKAEELKEKGYLVWLQAMATFLYSRGEMERLLDAVNRVRPDGFYMVDSFSTMYGEDVRQMADQILARLSPDIQFGFHAHNNIQLAYANVIEFFSVPTDRALIADGSIYGMGRGAGNVPTELMMEYLNKFAGGKYDIMKVLRVFQQEIRPIFRQYYWGYSPEYYLTASKGTNSAYSWYLGNREIRDLTDLDEILDRIPPEVRYTLSREAADEAVRSYCEEKRL